MLRCAEKEEEVRVDFGGSCAAGATAGWVAKLRGEARLRAGTTRGKNRLLNFERFLLKIKQLNSDSNLNSSNQKQCASMNATINSYDSLI